MAKFHLIPIVLGAAIGVGVYVVSKYLAQDEESEQIVDDSAFDDSEASESTEDAGINRTIPHNSKCRYGERGAAAAKPKAQIILDVLSSILATQMPCRSCRSGA